MGFVGGALASPIAARAQQPAKVARVGYLGFGTSAAAATRIEALRAGLNDLGYAVGATTAEIEGTTDQDWAGWKLGAETSAPTSALGVAASRDAHQGTTCAKACLAVQPSNGMALVITD
jgi:hypothetical protein